MWGMLAFSHREAAAHSSSSPLDGMPTLRQVCVPTDVAKAHPNGGISHSASRFQAVFVMHCFWPPDCFFLVLANVFAVNGVRNAQAST